MPILALLPMLCVYEKPEWSEKSVTKLSPINYNGLQKSKFPEFSADFCCWADVCV